MRGSAAPIHEQRPEEALGALNEVEQRFAPQKLFLQGDLSLLHDGVRVAVVGTRQPSPQGMERTARIVRALVRRQVIVVSGLALGVDTIAHTQAIELGGRTIAVLGTPLDVCSTRQNTVLQQRIASEHLLVSQFSCSTPVNRRNFPMRNRTMALLSHASIVVEAGETSGALSQAWESLRLGRPLLIPAPLVHDPRLRWPRELLDYGAEVVASPEEVLEHIPMSASNQLPDLAF